MLRAFSVFLRGRRNLCSSIGCAGLGLALCIPTLQGEESDSAGLLAPEQKRQTSGSTAANPVRLSAVDSVIQRAITDNGIPGAVLVVGHNAKVIYRKAYGHRALEPKREPMTLDTIFDLASLTKVVATTTAIMQLMEQGKVRLNDPWRSTFQTLPRTVRKMSRFVNC